MYRHILIPTDGSELSRRAVQHGLALAKAVGAKVTALTVEGSFDVYTVPASRVQERGGCGSISPPGDGDQRQLAE